MGACTSQTKKTKAQFFLKTCQQLQLPKEISSLGFDLQILTSSLLYNLIAKNHNRGIGNLIKHYEVIDVRPNAEFSAIHIYDSINLDLKDFYQKKQELPKEFKIVLNLKHLIIVGWPTPLLGSPLPEQFVYFFKELERTGIKLNTIYIYQERVEDFLKTYEFFSNKAHESISKYFLPMLIFDREDILPIANPHVRVVKPSSQVAPISATQRVYVQLFQKFDSYFPDFLSEGLNTDLIYFSMDIKTLGNKYKEFSKKVNQSVAPSQGEKYAVYTENIRESKSAENTYLPTMIKTRKNFIVVDEASSSNCILNYLKDSLSTHLKIDSDSTWRYIQERVPKFNTVIIEDSVSVPNKKPRQKGSQGNLDDAGSGTQTRLDELRLNLSSLKKEARSYNTVKDLYDLIMRIVENILKNPDDEKYRNLNKGNVNLKNTIFKYQSSVKILEIVGFLNPDQHSQLYTNSLDAPSIKLVRGDLELAFRQFSDLESKK